MLINAANKDHKKVMDVISSQSKDWKDIYATVQAGYESAPNNDTGFMEYTHNGNTVIIMSNNQTIQRELTEIAGTMVGNK